MSRADEIYPIRRQLERNLEQIKSDPHNADALSKYYQARVAEGISTARIYKCISTLNILSRRLGKPFSDAVKDDFIRLVSEIEQSSLSDWTKRDYKVILKHFYRWLRGWEDGSPPETRWIKKTSRGLENKTPILPKDLLTADEKIALIRAAKNPRDRALIEVFSESGRRLRRNTLPAHKGGGIRLDRGQAVCERQGGAGLCQADLFRSLAGGMA